MTTLQSVLKSSVLILSGSAAFAVDPGLFLNTGDQPWTFVPQNQKESILVGQPDPADGVYKVTEYDAKEGKAGFTVEPGSFAIVEAKTPHDDFTQEFKPVDSKGKTPRMAYVRYHVSRKSPGVNIPKNKPGKVFVERSNGLDRPMAGGPMSNPSPNVLIISGNAWD